MSTPRVWINACEPSGDMHAAILAKALRKLHPGIQLSGMGGSGMEEQQVDLKLRMEGLSVMGITEVFAYLPKVFGMWRTIGRELAHARPDAVVLVDSPDFHFRVAKMASRLGIPVFYYISPQVWAWRRGRIKFLRRYVHRMLCILPFEQSFYRAHGLEAEYVGHPLLEELQRPDLLAISPVKHRIGILPGSRKSEIERMMPVFTQTAIQLLQLDPALEFCVFKAPGVSEDRIRAYCPPKLPLCFIDHPRRYEEMRSCSLILATSGTVTLESALLQVPTIVGYKFSRLSFLVGVRLVKVPAISLANLILRKNVLPEFVQHQARADKLAEQAWQWLSRPEDMQRVQRELARLPEMLTTQTACRHDSAGPADRSAAIILGDLGWNFQQSGCGWT
ncbi:lipid-A-disaccharide synthase [Desulfonatronum parangueonense]